MQRGGFPGAVGTDQRDQLPVPHGEGDALQGVNRAVIDVQILDFQHICSLPYSPRYAVMTRGLAAISSGRPQAMVWP